MSTLQKVMGMKEMSPYGDSSSKIESKLQWGHGSMATGGLDSQTNLGPWLSWEVNIYPEDYPKIYTLEV